MRVSLAPDQSTDQTYPQAVLTVWHRLGRPVAAAELRLATDRRLAPFSASLCGKRCLSPTDGPAVLVELTAPPGATVRRRVPLPGVQARQDYRVRLWDRYDDGRADQPAPALLAETTASIDWPLETLAAGTVIRPEAYAALGEPSARWPTTLRRQTLIALAAMVILTGFALLAPWRAPRVLGVLASVAAGAALLAALARCPAASAVEVVGGHVVYRRADGSLLHQSMLCLIGRRGDDIRLDARSLRPVYPDLATMARDTTRLRLERPVGDPALSQVRLAPGQMLLLMGATSPATTRGAVPPPVVRTLPGDNPRELLLTSQGPLPMTLLVLGDRFVPLPAMPPERAHKADLSADLPLAQLRQSPEQFGLSPDALVLFNWWDRLHRPAHTPCLLWPAGSPDDPWLLATEARPD